MTNHHTPLIYIPLRRGLLRWVRTKIAVCSGALSSSLHPRYFVLVAAVAPWLSSSPGKDILLLLLGPVRQRTSCVSSIRKRGDRTSRWSESTVDVCLDRSTFKQRISGFINKAGAAVWQDIHYGSAQSVYTATKAFKRFLQGQGSLHFTAPEAEKLFPHASLPSKLE